MGSLFQSLKSLVKEPLEARFGRLEVRLAYQRHLAGIPSITEALATLRSRWTPAPAVAAGERPIFILSTGWRSGSTLLQRLVMSDASVLIWGEPYAHCGYIGSMAASLRVFTPEYPPDEWMQVHDSTPAPRALAEKWIANLYPFPSDLLDAHRAFLVRLYGDSARRSGYARWGIKEVRLGIEEARYLKTLFPEGRFVVLHRNPFDAWRSYRLWRSWYYRWPDEPIFTPRAFGRLWVRLAEGLLSGAAELGAEVVAYDDLGGGTADLNALGRYLGVTLSSEEVLARRIAGREVIPGPIPRAELGILNEEVGAVAARYGYHARE